MGYIKLIGSDAPLTIYDYVGSKGVSNFNLSISGSVGAKRMTVSIKIDDNSPIIQKVIHYLAKPIKAIVSTNRAVEIKDLELYQKGKDPFTIEGSGWLV